MKYIIDIYVGDFWGKSDLISDAKGFIIRALATPNTQYSSIEVSYRDINKANAIYPNLNNIFRTLNMSYIAGDILEIRISAHGSNSKSGFFMGLFGHVEPATMVDWLVTNGLQNSINTTGFALEVLLFSCHSSSGTANQCCNRLRHHNLHGKLTASSCETAASDDGSILADTTGTGAYLEVGMTGRINGKEIHGFYEMLI